MNACPRLCLVLSVLLVCDGQADWPMLKGGARHDGFVAAELQFPVRLSWVRSFLNERLGTAVEPIVAGNHVFIATHGGQLLALHGATGEPVWRFQAHGPFLHSPAFEAGRVVAASVDGRVYAVNAADGKLVWQSQEYVGGFSASPVIEAGRVFLGTRGGTFLAFQLADGTVAWRQDLAVPIRQTAAVGDGKVFVTAEDLRVRCFSRDGATLWTSQPLRGQTARDYYPVVVQSGGRTRVIVRTNPSVDMARRIGTDRQMLARQAGADDSDWRKLDAWIKSDAARGDATLWSREQEAIRQHLQQDPEARTFFVLDGETGREDEPAPVLWAAGCQGVGTPPALTADGRLLVFHRSAYGNWNHGVAPLVALGLLDLPANRVEPLLHTAGNQPPWNHFWGTADESQNFVVVGRTVLIVHQGTLSGFDLETKKLSPLQGERDTFGGFRSPAWARNEWHGPARGGVAFDRGRIYWITGSRLLCLDPGASGQPVPDRTIDPAQVPGETAPKLASVATEDLSKRLHAGVRQLLTEHWAPLRVESGLAGREFLFDDNAEVFEAMAWAYPFLEPDLQKLVRRWLGEEWETFPPYTLEAWRPLDLGGRREWVRPASGLSNRVGSDQPFHPFGNLQSIALYAERCAEEKNVLRSWPRLKACFEDFERTGWKLDGTRGDLWANRYLGSLLAIASMAEKAGDAEVAGRATTMADATIEALLIWWQRAAADAGLREFKGVADLDPFIGQGSALSFRLAPHRHKLALFHDLSPAVAKRLRDRVPDAIGQVWNGFDVLYRTWPLQGEERQVHFGENFIDPPDLALDAFRTFAWLGEARPSQLARRVDIPFCKADLAYITKLALVLETSNR